jgi:hypothetical protein
MMKKNKVFVFGLPVILLALGLVMAACDNGTDDSDPGSDPDPDFYGVWKVVDVSSTFHISAGELSLGNEAGTTIYMTASINRWEAVTNNGETEGIAAAEYPAGYRLIGTVTSWNISGMESGLGESFEQTWYLSADKRSITYIDNTNKRVIIEKQIKEE